jgi:transcriptional regulator with XRE-family HTH domain
MNNSQEIAFKIKQTAKEHKISVKQLLDKCDLNVNYISDLAKGKQASALNISKIADVLNVSVDYLLGRTDEPTNTMTCKTVAQPQLDETTSQVAEAFKDLTLKDKVKVMSLITELSEKKRA